MRFVKVLGIMVFGPLLGIVVGLIVGRFLFPDPSGWFNPGNGILILFCAGCGLLFSLPISVLLGIWSWRKSTKLRAH
jgi:hypothetical protein